MGCNSSTGQLTNLDASSANDTAKATDTLPTSDASENADAGGDTTGAGKDATEPTPDSSGGKADLEGTSSDVKPRFDAGPDGTGRADLGADSPSSRDVPTERNPDDVGDATATNDLGPGPRDGGEDTTPTQTDAQLALPLGPVSVVADDLLSENATTVKSYDTNVNIASYRQHGILFHGGYQYVSWFNGNTRNAIVGRRSMETTTLKAEEWSWAYVDFILASGADSHNVMSMGVSKADERLHIAIGQHGAQLYSIRTVPGALAAATWDNTAFGGSGTSSSGAAKPVTGLPGYGGPTGDATYPYFVTAPDGTLQFAYRTGSSGDGEMRLAEYDSSTGNWSAIGQFTSATGNYSQNGVTSNSRNAYPNGLDYDGAGRLHMTFTFRENLSLSFFANCANTISNHDTLYMYSDDGGRVWKNNGGATVADTRAGTTAGVASPGLVVDPLPIGRDMMNQETQVTDHRNLIHAVVSYVPERFQTACANDRSQAQPHHLWRDGAGRWTKDEIRPGGKDVNQGYDRSKAFVDAADNLYVLLPDLRLLGASAATDWTDWQLLWDGRSRGNYGEAIIDYNLTRVADGVSVVYMKDTSGTTGELHVLDLKLHP